MKYVVAEGVTFGSKNKNYYSGDEITRDVFSPSDAFDKFVKDGKIIPVEGSKPAATVKSEEKTEEKAEAPKDEPKEEPKKEAVKVSEKGNKGKK